MAEIEETGLKSLAVIESALKKRSDSLRIDTICIIS